MISFSSLNGFLSSFLMILVSEIGDKTFFIACLMAMQYNRFTVYLGALSALAVMTILSAFLGFIIPRLISVHTTKLISGALFFFFAVKTLYSELSRESEPSQDDMEEAAEALRASEQECIETSRSKLLMCWNTCTSPVFAEAFVLTFLAEWGDRSQIATIILAAVRDPYTVSAGAIAGHAICTGMAVIGGSMISTYVSSRTIGIAGGLLFFLFGIATILEAVIDNESSSILLPSSSLSPSSNKK